MTVRLQNMKKSELTEQIKLISWARSICDYVPELKLLHHVPNEGKKANGTVLKAAGYCEGVEQDWTPCASCKLHRKLYKTQK